MGGKQLSFLSESELAKMISPDFPRLKNRAEWELRKSRLGVIRADLTKNLLLSERGCPIIKPYFGIPDSPLIDFKEALASNSYNYWVHFFIDDVSFEQIWNPRYTNRDIEILSRYCGVFTPDFTLKPNLSPWQEQFNILRSRTIGQLLQCRNVPVIPTVGWSFRKSFDYCFEGLSEGGTVAISTNGVKSEIVSLRMFLEGVFEMERRLKPRVIMIYGDKIEVKTKALQVWIPNNTIAHLRNLDKRTKTIRTVQK